MSHVTIEPVSRFVEPGAEVSFKVTSDDSEVSAVKVIPCNEARNYEVDIAGKGTIATFEEDKLIIKIKTPKNARLA